MSTDSIVQKSLSELEFKKWRLIMRQIDALLLERAKNDKRQMEINKQLKPLHQQMERLWKHNRAGKNE